MKNLEVAKIFERTADVLALLGENSFRILAYRKISRVLEELPDDIAKLSEAGKLQDVPGIGASSAERIVEYLRTGKVAEFDELLAQIPAGVLQMIKIPTLGPKTATLLWREGGVTTIETLKAKIDDGSLTNLPGLGAKKLLKIKENIAHLETSSGRIRIGEAYPVAETLVEFLRGLPGVVKADFCGSLRRGKETIGDIDIAVAAPMKAAALIGVAVTKHPYCATVIQLGESKTSIRTGNGLQIDVRVVPPESWGAALQYFTGSTAHNVRLREMAIKKGLKLNEWGVYKVTAGKEKAIAGETEEGVYAALGMAWVPPEMREDKGEIERALAAPKDTIELIEQKHIRGDLHSHTTASDGSRTIEEMVAEAKRRGYEYLAITDHSKSQFQANGLKADRLIEHVKAIRAVAKDAAKSGMLLLAGSEVDILADGSLDYEDDILSQLDWVVGSPHAALTQDTIAATDRMVRACANPHLHVIGHPTGRIVPSRRGLEFDIAKVIFAAARNGIALEINANYHRLDLRDTHARLAVEAKVPLCIDTDAHSFEDFDQMIYGVLTARRAWATKADILNTKTIPELKRWLQERKAQAQWD